MEKFSSKPEMIEKLKKRGIIMDGIFLYGQNPTEYAGVWKYAYPPKSGQEDNTPVQADLIRKYQKPE